MIVLIVFLLLIEGCYVLLRKTVHWFIDWLDCEEFYKEEIGFDFMDKFTYFIISLFQAILVGFLNWLSS